MLIWTIQASVISIIFIFLIHHLFCFLKSTLTVPKIKDLVNSPTQKYENMFSILNNSTSSSFLSADNIMPSITISKNNNPYADTDQITNSSLAASSMKNELKNFLKKQLQPDNVTNDHQETPFRNSFAFAGGSSSSSIGSTPIDLNNF